jgi:hypothetical protein
MWVLEGHVFRGELAFSSLVYCFNADAHEGKTLWLKPGKRYIFGRTRENGKCTLVCVAI